jgi:hypothetical protein
MTRRNVVGAEASSSVDAARVVVVVVVVVVVRRLAVTIVVDAFVDDAFVDERVDARAGTIAVVARDAVAPTRARASVIEAPSARASDAA